MAAELAIDTVSTVSPPNVETGIDTLTWVDAPGASEAVLGDTDPTGTAR